MSQETTSNTNTNNMSLDESSTSFTQLENQGMGAVGNSAADIEIYMGEQSTEMAAAPGAPGVMGGSSKAGVMGGARKDVVVPKKEGESQ